MSYRKRVAPGVYKSQNGRYSIRYKAAGRVVDRGGYRTLEEARTARNRALADHSRGIKARPRRTTVAQYYAEWFPRYERSVRPNTAISVEHCMRLHVLPAVGSVPLDELTPRHLQRWLDEVALDLPGSVGNARAALSSMLTDAVHYEVLYRNPLVSVRSPARPPRRRVTLTPEQLVAYLKVAPPILCWVALTGCRIGEARGMLWADVDLLGGTWLISRNWTGGKTTPAGRPKTAAGFRAIPVTDGMRALLPPVGSPGERVWGDLSKTRWFHRHHDALAEIGVQGVTIHDLRHTWATIALASGIHPKLVQQQLGHSKIAVTLDTYSHVMPEHSRHAAETIEEVLRRAAGEGFVEGLAIEPPPD